MVEQLYKIAWNIGIFFGAMLIGLACRKVWEKAGIIKKKEDDEEDKNGKRN